MAIALAAGAASVFFETALVVVVKDLFPGPGLILANSALEVASQARLVAGCCSSPPTRWAWSSRAR